VSSNLPAQPSIADIPAGVHDAARDTQGSASGPSTRVDPSQDFDLERQKSPRSSQGEGEGEGETDPFLFRGAVVSEEELVRLRKRGSKKTARYQLKQNEVRRRGPVRRGALSDVWCPQLIDNLLKPMEKHTAEAQEQEEAARLPVRRVPRSRTHMIH
jgi:hypothetical protein